MATICLITPGQPSTSPRLVKEADALSDAGHDVHVIAAHWVAWADAMDRDLLAARHWACTFVGGDPFDRPLIYYGTRARQRAGRAALALRVGPTRLQSWSVSRVLPELARAAQRIPADLYIGHNLGALAPAVEAAKRRGAQAGYDAEDLLTGETASRPETVSESLERLYMPQCDYITAASPGIAEAYASKYGLDLPVTVLNVFPISDRPASLRAAQESSPLQLYWFSQTIGPFRGLEDVVRAMGTVRDDLQLHLRGWWQSGYEDALRSLARECGLHSHQLIWHPPGPPDEMVRLASEYDVGLALEQPADANRDVCLTNKIFTYLLAGNAIIATRTRGQQPIVDSIDEAGVAYAAGDVEALAKQLRLWVSNRASLERARRTSWEWGTRRYNWDREKEIFLQTVERTLQRTVPRIR